MLQFEFHAFPGDRTGAIASKPEITRPKFASDSAAKSAAGRLAKRIQGPVDIARYGARGRGWNERYLTTANPCPFSKSGFRFERID